MKIERRIKRALFSVLVACQVSTAKSLLPSNSIGSVRACKSCHRPPLFIRPSQQLRPKAKISSTSCNALALRAGGIAGSLPSLTTLNILFKQHPYVAAFMICGLQASAADLIAQKSSQKTSNDKVVEVRGGTAAAVSRPSFELKRNLAFLLYGGAYQGCFQEHLFNNIFPMIFGEGRSPLIVALKVTFDMLVISPFLCLPVAYLIKGAIYQSSFMESVKRYIHDVRQNALLKTYWSVWYPVQIVNFMLVPKQFRISFIACFSFFWLIMLSSISGKSRSTAEA